MGGNCGAQLFCRLILQEFIDPSLDLVHFVFDEVGSTNDEAFRLAAERGLKKLCVTARRQNNGRGRRGRAWDSQAGNLYASFFLAEPAEARLCPQLSFLAAVAMCEALRDCVGEAAASAIAVKWPNDLLWGGAKIAGLLLEARQEAGALNIVIGIGVNCLHYPDGTPYPATSLAAEKIRLAPDDLFYALKERFFDNLALWARGQNFALIREKWMALVHGLADTIIVRLEKEEISGRFLAIDEAGQLVLGLSGGRQRLITAGDVFFPATTR